MPYPNIRRQLEQQYGEPMEQLLPRKLNELGSQEAVAQEFRVTTTTIQTWGREIGLRRVWATESTCTPHKN